MMRERAGGIFRMAAASVMGVVTGVVLSRRIRRGVGRVLRLTLRGPYRLLLRLFDGDDPWEPLAYRVRPGQFGPGSTRDFGWYFEGDSTVPVESLDDVCDWLVGCEYLDDKTLFNEPDFWQHPRTFEHLRRGDCEDHALWAWRKLIELGKAARLVAGQQRSGDEYGGHVWVVFEQDGQVWLLEATSKNRDAMVRPLAEVRDEYRPAASVDGALDTSGYVGYMHAMAERMDRRRDGAGPEPGSSSER